VMCKLLLFIGDEPQWQRRHVYVFTLLTIGYYFKDYFY